jgi:hypothetical protein
MPVDATIKKVSGKVSPRGQMDQTYLVSGKRVSLRLWQNEKPQKRRRPNGTMRRLATSFQDKRSSSSRGKPSRSDPAIPGSCLRGPNTHTASSPSLRRSRLPRLRHKCMAATSEDAQQERSSRQPIRHRPASRNEHREAYRAVLDVTQCTIEERQAAARPLGAFDDPTLGDRAGPFDAAR